MTAIARRRTVTTLVVAATVATVWVVGDPGGSALEGSATSPAEAATLEPATVAEFCTAFETLAKAVAAGNSGQNVLAPREAIDLTEVKSAAALVRDTGARAPLPPDVGRGLNYITGIFLALPDDTLPEDVGLADDDATVTDTYQVDRLVGFLDRNCGKDTSTSH